MWQVSFADSTSSDGIYNLNGVLDVVDGQGISGSKAARFGSGCDFNVTANALDLNLNLSGQGEVELSVDIRDFFDETQSEDGIYFSDDAGLNFVKVLDFDFAAVSGFQNYILDVDQLITQNGLVFSSQFVIRFQQYDNSDFNTSFDEDGMFMDNILIFLP